MERFVGTSRIVLVLLAGLSVASLALTSCGSDDGGRQIDGDETFDFSGEDG